MFSNRVKILWLVAIISIATALSGIASAHLMVAQRGTLNFTDKGVYMVLSLPASVFTEADNNNDRKLQTAEFIEHRQKIISKIASDVLMHSESSAYTIEGMMLTPVHKDSSDHQHNGEATPVSSGASDATTIEQIIVMGRFPVAYSADEKLFFETSLVGKSEDEQKLTIVAKRANKTHIHEFAIVVNDQKARLFPTDH